MSVGPLFLLPPFLQNQLNTIVISLIFQMLSLGSYCLFPTNSHPAKSAPHRRDAIVSSPPFSFSSMATSCSRCQRRLVSSPTSNGSLCDVTERVVCVLLALTLSSPHFSFSLIATSCSRCQRRSVCSPTSKCFMCDVIERVASMVLAVTLSSHSLLSYSA